MHILVVLYTNSQKRWNDAYQVYGKFENHLKNKIVWCVSFVSALIHFYSFKAFTASKSDVILTLFGYNNKHSTLCSTQTISYSLLLIKYNKKNIQL